MTSIPDPDELERYLGEAARRGATVEFDSCGQDVGAEALRVLLTSDSTPAPRAINLRRAHIVGPLELVASALRCPLWLNQCRFSERIMLSEATAPSIRLTDCDLVSLIADQLETRGNLDLSGSRSTGELRLRGARIGGELRFDGACLTNGAGGPALDADGLRVNENMRCDDGFAAKGAIRLSGAHIGGQLNFNGAELANKGGSALRADRLRVDQDMLCREICAGGLSLLGARIGGQLDFDGARLYAPSERAETAARSSEPSGRRDPRSNAQPRPAALHADGLEVNQSMFCEGVTVDGELRLVGAHIGGQLSFDGAKPAKDREWELRADHLRADQDVLLRFAGRPSVVDLTAARLGRWFDSECAWPKQLRVRGCVYEGVEEAVEDARCVEAVEDAPEQQASRPAKGKAWFAARLGHLWSGAPPDVQQRLKWLRLVDEGQRDEGPPDEGPPDEGQRDEGQRDEGQRVLRVPERVDARGAGRLGAGYAPQPYTQLMSFYRQEGRDGDARRVAYARERRRRRQLGLPGRAWNVFLQGTVGYGYKPLRALAWLGALVVVGACVFSSYHSDGDLTAVREDHPPFVATIYTLDRLIPVVGFGLRDAFAPSGSAQWWAFAYTLLGWALTVAVVAGLNTAVRRD